MKRLTKRVFGSEAYIYSDYIQERPFTCDNKRCYYGEGIERLAAYEDTGLTPERCAELAQAEQDGRLVVLPCKDGDKIFSISWFVIAGRYEVRESEIKNVRYNSSDGSVMVSDGEAFRVWGKRAFATREAAEAALEAAGKE